MGRVKVRNDFTVVLVSAVIQLKLTNTPAYISLAKGTERIAWMEAPSYIVDASSTAIPCGISPVHSLSFLLAVLKICVKMSHLMEGPFFPSLQTWLNHWYNPCIFTDTYMHSCTYIHAYAHCTHIPLHAQTQTKRTYRDQAITRACWIRVHAYETYHNIR